VLDSSDPMSPMISAPRIACEVAMKLRTSFVHSHRTPIEHLSNQRSNSGLGLRRLRHLDKSDTAWLTSIPVLDDRDGFDGSVFCKNFSQLLLCHRDIKVSDKNVGHEFILPLKGTEAESPKGDLDGYRLLARRCVLGAALRSQLDCPWGPSSRETAWLDPPEGFLKPHGWLAEKCTKHLGHSDG